MGGNRYYNQRFSVLENLQALQTLHELIKQQRTGQLLDIGKVLHMTKSSVLRRVDMLRELGAEIEYDPVLKTYYYLKPFEFKITIKS